MGRRLGKDFFCRDPVVVARELLGKLLVSEIPGVRVSGMVVETEAYLGPHDRASHGYGWKRRKGSWPLFEDCGLTYVYRVHGKPLLNVTTYPPKEPTAVLIRALEPVEGIEVMARLRGVEVKGKADLKKLCSGPAKLCQALGIGIEHNGLSLEDGPIYFEEFRDPGEVIADKRVGVDYAGAFKDLPLRFLIDSPFVSKRPSKASL